MYNRIGIVRYSPSPVFSDMAGGLVLTIIRSETKIEGLDTSFRQIRYIGAIFRGPTIKFKDGSHFIRLLKWEPKYEGPYSL